jgi:hypothetical protein
MLGTNILCVKPDQNTSAVFSSSFPFLFFSFLFHVRLKAWKDLSAKELKAAKTLGYTPKNWCDATRADEIYSERADVILYTWAHTCLCPPSLRDPILRRPPRSFDFEATTSLVLACPPLLCCTAGQDDGRAAFHNAMGWAKERREAGSLPLWLDRRCAKKRLFGGRAMLFLRRKEVVCQDRLGTNRRKG